MKKYFTAFVLALMTASAVADTYPATGFYRVQNKATKRYTYVCDNVGSINWATTSAEMGAICLFKDPQRRLSDPASVIYIKEISANEHKYDLQSQNTGVYSLIQHYVQLSYRSGSYWIYATQDGTARYLSDERKATTREDGQMGTNGKDNYRLWDIIPISSTSSEFFGIKPALKSGDKYYQPFYAGFAFKLVSPGMKVYYISAIDNAQGVAVLKEYKKDIMAAQVPYIIECSSDDPADNKLEVLLSGGTKPSDNLLAGNFFFNPDHDKAGDKAYKEFDKSKMRMLEVSAAGQLQFQNTSSRLLDYEDFPGRLFLPANQSYLPVPAGTAATLKVIDESDYVGISQVAVDEFEADAVYSLTGERVATGAASLDELPTGMYVIGGRKIQIR